MKKISSKSTFLYKRLFPLAWFGSMVYFMVQSWSSGALEKDPVFLIMPIIMAIFSYFLIKRFLWVLVDEVYDCGDSLLVKNRGTEERIELSNIMNVNASIMMNPPQVTLRLINPGRMGNEVTFSPAATGFSINTFAKNAIAEDLIMRAHQARAAKKS